LLLHEAVGDLCQGDILDNVHREPHPEYHQRYRKYRLYLMCTIVGVKHGVAEHVENQCEESSLHILEVVWGEQKHLGDYREGDEYRQDSNKSIEYYYRAVVYRIWGVGKAFVIH
jgi:hypothetical protein